MIPAVDEIDNQARNAFPVDVAANQQQPVFVEYHVPQGAAAGWYSGTVHVTGGIKADIPVKLYVHAFSLPSTSSLPSAYGIGWNDACTAHYGGYSQCGGDAGVQAINNKYTRFALDHRISLSEVVYNGPAQKSDGSYDWSTWDAMYGPMLDGGMGGRLHGAKLTSVRYMWDFDTAHYAEWAKHFRAKGWFDRTFDYSCDEPPAGCTWSQHQHAHCDGPRGRPRLPDAGDDDARRGHAERRAAPASTCWSPASSGSTRCRRRPTWPRPTTRGWRARRRRRCGCISRATPTAATASATRRSRAGRRT